MFPLISPEDLYDELRAHPDDIRIIDASYGDVCHEVYRRERIGRAVYFDIDDVADHHNPLPHMVPTASQFARQVGAMGISNQHKIVVYDQTGIIMAACRVWWMFRLFGHQNIVVLNGGLPTWKAAGFPVHTDVPSLPTLEVFTPDYQSKLYATMEDVEHHIESQSAILIDARPQQRFLGMMSQLRPHMEAENIPTSRNIPAMSLIESASGKMIAEDQLRDVFSHLNLTPESTVVTTCGSGVTACVDALALYILGIHHVAVYDGSWSEWSQKRR